VQFEKHDEFSKYSNTLVLVPDRVQQNILLKQIKTGASVVLKKT